MKEESNTIEKEILKVLTDFRYDDSLPKSIQEIQKIIRLAEDSLVEMVRNKMQKAMNELPSELTMMQSGVYLTLNNMLDWKELSAPKPKGDE